MPNYDYVFASTGLPPAVVASQLGERVGADVGTNAVGVAYVTRPGPGGTVVTATVEANDLGGPDDFEPDEVAAYAGYDTIIQLWTNPKDTERQKAEARRLFDDMTAELPHWPTLLTHALDVVIATWRDGTLHEFPDGISAWTSQRAVWQPLVVPYQPPSDLAGPSE